MTPECPKGPERGALPICNCETCQREFAERNAPIPYLRRHVAEAIFDALKAYNLTDVDVAADAIVAMVQPELERLTAEVSQLRADMSIRQGALNDVLGRDRSRDTPTDYCAAVEEVAELKREVSRLREQLAVQTLLPDNAEQLVSRWLLRDSGTVYKHEREGRQAARDLVAYMLQWGVSSFEVEVSQDPIVHTVLLSSDTGVMGEWQAFCSGCRQRYVGDLAHAELWKDQHLADTLTNESIISSQQAMDELSRQSQEFGCVRVDLVSQWKKGDKALYRAHSDDEGEECQIVGVALDTAIVEADPFPFGNPQRWSVDVSELHALPPREPSCEEVVPEGPEDASLCGQDVVPGSDRCEDHEGRPSGSGAAAPQATPVPAWAKWTECRASEGATGIDCHLTPGHHQWHSGRHTPRTDGTESVGYPLNVQWPRQEWDICAPEAEVWRRGDPEPSALVSAVRGFSTGNVYTRRLEGLGGPWDYETSDGWTWSTWEGLLDDERGAELPDARVDAAQAARSEATPKVWRDIRGCEWEEVALHDELRLIRTDPSHQREVGGVSFSRRYVEAHYGPLSEVSCTEQEAEK